jgi:RimJ/RimL family protein N-acetyltransferase
MLVLRPARDDDEVRLLRWRNDPSTRRASLTRQQISSDDHHAWLARLLNDPDCQLLIIEDEGRPVGQVRFDRVAPDIAVISIGLAVAERGRGLGREALRVARAEGHRRLAVTELRAVVRRGNLASLRAFAAAGFRPVGESADVIELAAPVGPGVRSAQNRSAKRSTWNATRRAP